MTNHLASRHLLVAPNHAGVHGFLPTTRGHTAGLASVQISTSTDGPQPPPLLATSIGFPVGSEELATPGAVIVAAGSQIVVVERKISQTGEVLVGTASRPTTMSSTIVTSFSKFPAAKDGNTKKKPITKNGTNDNNELTEVRSDELGGIQYHVCGLSFSCRSRLWAVPVALKAVVQGDDDGKVRVVDGMFVRVGSANAIGISIADRTNRASRMAILVAPGCLSGTLVVVVSMAFLALGSGRLTSTFSGIRRPARR